MILIDEITNEKAHLIQMRIEDFGRMITQHGESIEHARRMLGERNEEISRLRDAAAKLHEAHAREAKVDNATIGMLRAALLMLVDGVKPRSAKDAELFEQAKQTLDTTAPVPF